MRTLAPHAYVSDRDQRNRFLVGQAASAVFLCLITACGSSEPAVEDGTDSGKFSVTFAGMTVNPGEESTRCVVKSLKNPHALHINRIDNQLGPGSHHVIVYKTSDTTEQLTPFACQPFADLLKPAKGTPLLISQKSDDSFILPSGVGIPLDENQMIRVEMHYINATPRAIEVTSTATFYQMAESEFKAEAEFAMFSNTAVNLPPMSASMLGPLFLAVPAWLDGVKFLSFTGHMHKLGTRVKVVSTTAKDGPDMVIYDPPNFSYSEPPTVYQDVVLPPGGGFRLTCSWQNTTANPVKFGESAEDEMCLFWSYYYPSKGPLACSHTDLIRGGYDFCCPGDPICSMIF